MLYGVEISYILSQDLPGIFPSEEDSSLPSQISLPTPAFDACHLSPFLISPYISENTRTIHFDSQNKQNKQKIF